MEFYAAKQEVQIIQITSILWTSWELYRDWDKISKGFTTIYDWFTSEIDDEDAQPALDAQPQG